MIADAEVVEVISDILTSLNVGKFQIKINHRKLLEAIFEASNCDLNKFATICSSIDKLDKEPWDYVANELLEKKLDQSSIDLMKQFVLVKDSPQNM